MGSPSLVPPVATSDPPLSPLVRSFVIPAPSSFSALFPSLSPPSALCPCRDSGDVDGGAKVGFGAPPPVLQRPPCCDSGLTSARTTGVVLVVFCPETGPRTTPNASNVRCAVYKSPFFKGGSPRTGRLLFQVPPTTMVPSLVALQLWFRPSRYTRHHSSHWLLHSCLQPRLQI